MAIVLKVKHAFNKYVGENDEIVTLFMNAKRFETKKEINAAVKRNKNLELEQIEVDK